MIIRSVVQLQLEKAGGWLNGLGLGANLLLDFIISRPEMPHLGNIGRLRKSSKKK